MITIVEKNRCIGCGACASSCPKKCISLQFDEEGFLYPQIDQASCVGCRACETVCPIIKKQTIVTEENTHVFGCYSQDREIRMKSSSGGIFSILAEQFLKKHPRGVVFGATYDETMKVKHECVERIQDLPLLRGSKYVQSDIQEALVRVESYLKNGRAVYFSGTPCQIASLKAYLGNEYDLLYTQAILCHGVPSPKLWAEFVSRLETEYREKIIDARFRDKTHGWEQYQFVAVFANGEQVPIVGRDNWYTKAFGAGLSLRPACYNCHFKFPNYCADITIGDFWNMKEFCPSLYDPDGVSLVFVTTPKGKELFDEMRSRVTQKEIALSTAIRSQKGIVTQVRKPKKRDIWYAEVVIDPKKATARYCRTKLTTRIRKKMSRIYRQLIYMLKK